MIHMRYIKKTITINLNQDNWLKSRSINFSRFIQETINRAIEEDKNSKLRISQKISDFLMKEIKVHIFKDDSYKSLNEIKEFSIQFPGLFFMYDYEFFERFLRKDNNYKDYLERINNIEVANKKNPNRYKIFEKDNFKCVICGRDGKEVILEIDHIIPRSKGGKNDISNYQTLCRQCNGSKGNNEINIKKDANSCTKY